MARWEQRRAFGNLLLTPFDLRGRAAWRHTASRREIR